jgi:hypothetical protein
MSENERIPDNLKATLYWLFKKYDKARCHEFLPDRYVDMEDFLIDMREIACEDDSALTEDAISLKRKLRAL